jgi:hypothetical protein
MIARLFALFRRLTSSGVFWTGIVTLLRAAGFVLVLPVVLRRLPTDEVGLWYVYVGIAGFCGMIELGFAAVISRFASFYLAGLRHLPSLQPFSPSSQEESVNHSGLAGLVRASRQLYNVFAVVLLLAMGFGGGGWLLWKYREAFLQPMNLAAFAVFTAGTAWSMSGFFWTGMLFGINRVRDYQKAILGGLMLNYLIILVGVWLNWGILSLVVGQVALNIYQRLRSRAAFRKHCAIDAAAEPMPIRWRHFWPMTWRGGLMGYGIYLGYGAIALVCAQLFDLETAARYALSFQLVSMAYQLANGWIMVKYPHIASLYVQGHFAEIRAIMFRRIGLQMLSYVVLCAVAWKVAPLTLSFLKTKTNFFPPWPLFLMMVAGAVDLYVNSISAVVQNGNRFPFVHSKLINGITAVVLAFILGKWLGLNWLICAPFLAQLTYNGWYITWWCWHDLRKPFVPAPAAS